jgi:hypothetical protein
MAFGFNCYGHLLKEGFGTLGRGLLYNFGAAARGWSILFLFVATLL